MATTSVVNTDDFLKELIAGTKAAIERRVEKEIRPDIDRIVSEEVARIGLKVSAFMSFERTGAEIKITIIDESKKKVL